MKTRKQRILSPEQAAILRLFLDEEHPEYQARRLYGLEVMRLTKLPSGTIYPALDKLRQRGILSSEQEPYSGRPGRRRVYYTLSDVSGGHGALAEQEQARRSRESKSQGRPLVLAPAGAGRKR